MNADEGFFEDCRILIGSRIPVFAEQKKPNLLQKSMFIHVPKTGGTFVREHFAELPYWWTFLGVGHGRKADFPEHAHRFSFTFVREAREWLISFWTFYRLVLDVNNCYEAQARWANDAINKGIVWDSWRHDVNPVYVLWHPDFNIFLARILEHAPDLADMAFDYFARDVDFIGKTENLVPDLIQALEMAGENMDFYKPEIIESWVEDRRNVTKRQANFSYDAALMSAILERNPLIGEFYGS